MSGTVKKVKRPYTAVVVDSGSTSLRVVGSEVQSMSQPSHTRDAKLGSSRQRGLAINEHRRRFCEGLRKITASVNCPITLMLIDNIDSLIAQSYLDEG